MRVLVGHNWPGNIRQPRNLVERFLVTVDSQVNHANDLPDETRSVANGVVGTMAQAVEDAEKRAISAALSECDNHRERTAALLDISVRSLHYNMNRYGLH